MRLKNLFLPLALAAAPVFAEIAIITETKPVQSGVVQKPENAFALAGYLQKDSKPALLVVCHDFEEACQALQPIMAKIAADRAGKLDVVHVDPVRNAKFVSDMKLNIEQPVLLLYNEGKFHDVVVSIGNTPKQESIVRFIDRGLAQKKQAPLRIVK